MNNRFNYVVTLIISLILVSCNIEDGIIPDKDSVAFTEINYKLSPDEAVTILSDFLSAQEEYTKSRSMSSPDERNVLNIEAISKTSLYTRAMDEPNMSLDIDTLLYIINFKDNMGYAIVAADKRTEPIIALVDTGTFSLDDLQEGIDEGLLSFIDDAIQMEIKDITEYEQQPLSRTLVTNGYTISSYYQPILHTRWDQGYVYGKYCPNKLAGCAVIATAQILSHFKNIGQVNWSYNGIGGSAILHWDRIISDCDNHYGRLTSPDCSTSGDEIAHLVRYLGIALDAKYEDDSTGVGASKPMDWFNNWSGLKATKLKDYNESDIVSAIKIGNPVFGSGYSKKKKFLGIRVGWKGGHAWVFDGVMTASKDGKTSTLIHCNWGWNGRNNGYYISKAFDTNAGAIIYENEGIFGNLGEYQSSGTSNYQYHLQYSIISR